MSKSILVIEDDRDGQEILVRMFTRAKIPVEVTSSAEDALQLLSPEEHIAVVIDLALPGIDGFEMLKQIRNQPELKDLTCVAITAFHTPPLRQRAKTEGFEYYFSKPLDDVRFLQVMQQIFSS